MTIVTLTNGKRVGNFSSPHSFTFTDGTVLPAVSAEVANHLKVEFHEQEEGNGDISLSFSLSDAVMQEVRMWEKQGVDVVFCPLPMMTALKEAGYDIRNSPFRSIRIEDRVAKLVSIDKQCI